LSKFGVMMKKVKLRLTNIQYDAAGKQYQAHAIVNGPSTLTLKCAVPSARDADLRQVVRQLSSQAMRAYKATQPRPVLPILSGQMACAPKDGAHNRLH